jgi:hypothetical protein
MTNLVTNEERAAIEVVVDLVALREAVQGMGDRNQEALAIECLPGVIVMKAKGLETALLGRRPELVQMKERDLDKAVLAHCAREVVVCRV